MAETAQEAIAAGIHRYYLDVGPVPADASMALAQAVIAETAAFLRAHSEPRAAELLEAGIRDPYAIHLEREVRGG